MGKLDGLAADVHFCREMRADGVEVVAGPSIQVPHHFGFTIWKSLVNAASKSYTWTRYALTQRALLTDSGSASTEMKLCGIFSGLFTACLLPAVLAGSLPIWLLSLLPLGLKWPTLSLPIWGDSQAYVVPKGLLLREQPGRLFIPDEVHPPLLSGCWRRSTACSVPA